MEPKVTVDQVSVPTVRMWVLGDSGHYYVTALPLSRIREVTPGTGPWCSHDLVGWTGEHEYTATIIDVDGNYIETAHALGPFMEACGLDIVADLAGSWRPLD